MNHPGVTSDIRYPVTPLRQFVRVFTGSKITGIRVVIPMPIRNESPIRLLLFRLRTRRIPVLGQVEVFRELRMVQEIQECLRVFFVGKWLVFGARGAESQ